jgi:hypothetical protein
MISNDNIMFELIKNQRKNISVDKKLSYNDLKRISKYLQASVFLEECSMWNGYVTVIKNDEKNSYINFYFNGKKNALHRLLYINFIGELGDSEYIKFKCINKGKCCNIHHFYKINKDNDNEKHDVVIVTEESNKKDSQENIIVNFSL